VVPRARVVTGEPLREFVAAVSVGIVAGVPVLDLDYGEDSSLRYRHERRDDGGGGFVELQGTPRARRSRAPKWKRWSRWPNAVFASWSRRSAPL
jgi:hypothetical protein